jgi:hypothetical protein
MTIDQGVSIGIGVVQTISTVVLVVVAWRALREAGRQATTASDAVRAMRETAADSTREARRLQLLSEALYLRMSRPALDWPGISLSVPIENLGPGEALHVGVRLEAQDRGSTGYRPTLHGTFPRPIVAYHERPELTISTEDLRNMGAKFGETTTDGYGQPVVPPIPSNALVPERIRVTVTWLSTLGAKIEQAYLWETRDLTQESDWSWRFESLSIDPGSSNGQPAVVRAD